MNKPFQVLITKWKQRIEEYENQAFTGHGNLYDSNRYEGIATGTRWCLEDLIRWSKDMAAKSAIARKPKLEESTEK